MLPWWQYFKLLMLTHPWASAAIVINIIIIMYTDWLAKLECFLYIIVQELVLTFPADNYSALQRA